MPVPVIELSPATQQTIEFWQRVPIHFDRTVVPASRVAAKMLSSKVSQTQFTGSPLNVRTGNLRRSVDADVVRIGDNIIARIGVLKGPSSRYARILEEGGEIRPRKARALAVPLSAARTAGGRDRFPGGPAGAKFKGKYPDAFMLKRPGKPPLIVVPRRVRGSKNGRVAGLMPMFALVKSVRIPRTEWLSRGVARNMGVWEVEFEREFSRRIRDL